MPAAQRTAAAFSWADYDDDPVLPTAHSRRLVPLITPLLEFVPPSQIRATASLTQKLFQGQRLPGDDLGDDGTALHDAPFADAAALHTLLDAEFLRRLPCELQLQALSTVHDAIAKHCVNREFARSAGAVGVLVRLAASLAPGRLRWWALPQRLAPLAVALHAQRLAGAVAALLAVQLTHHCPGPDLVRVLRLVKDADADAAPGTGPAAPSSSLRLPLLRALATAATPVRDPLHSARAGSERPEPPSTHTHALMAGLLRRQRPPPAPSAALGRGRAALLLRLSNGSLTAL
jgi:hypothetical protein